MRKVTSTAFGHILVAGSEEMLRKVISNTLKEAGYDVVIAHGGLEALYAINTFQITANPFDLVIMDANWHELSDSASSVKLGLFNITTPMMIINAKKDSNQHCFVTRASTFYLETPILKEELLLKVKELIHDEGEPDPTDK